MNTTPKLSEVTKALKGAGVTEISADEALRGIQPANTYFKYKGELHIKFGRIGFGVESARGAKIFRKYHITAIDENNSAYEVATDWPEFFYPRLFGYLSGEVSEEQVISEVCS